MRFLILVILLSNTLFIPPSSAEKLEVYQYCHIIFQNLEARKDGISRIITTIKYHRKAFEEYKKTKQERFAEYHKQYQIFLNKLLIQQEKKYKNYEMNYKKECILYYEPPKMKDE